MTGYFNETGRHLVGAFLDINAAYATFHRDFLGNKLIERGVSEIFFGQSLFSATLEHRNWSASRVDPESILYALFVNDSAARLRAVSTLKLGDQVAN